MDADERLRAFRRLVYEPEHTETMCWCEPKFVKTEAGLLQVVHNEQRDVLTDYVRQHFL